MDELLSLLVQFELEAQPLYEHKLLWKEVKHK